jgi:hypothetical protein
MQERDLLGNQRKRKCLVCRCLACGHNFDEIEAQESPEPEEGGGPSFD